MKRDCYPDLPGPKVNFKISNAKMCRLQNFREFITLSEENTKDEEDSEGTGTDGKETSIERAI